MAARAWMNDPKWHRVAYTALFLVVFSLLKTLVLVLGVAQLVFLVMSGRPQPALVKVGQWLSRYSSSLILYVSQASNKRPFPLHDSQ